MPATILGQERCTDTFAPPPRGPMAPEQALPVRSVITNEEGPQRAVTLRWVNKATNANCTLIEAKHTQEPDFTAGGLWVPLETIDDPTVNQYLHKGVPASGWLCYRLYASNRSGRSEYSNRVCLEMGGTGFPQPITVPGGEGPAGGGAGTNAWYILAIALPVGIVLAAGAAAWAYRIRHSKAKAR